MSNGQGPVGGDGRPDQTKPSTQCRATVAARFGSCQAGSATRVVSGMPEVTQCRSVLVRQVGALGKKPFGCLRWNCDQENPCPLSAVSITKCRPGTPSRANA